MFKKNDKVSTPQGLVVAVTEDQTFVDWFEGTVIEPRGVFVRGYTSREWKFSLFDRVPTDDPTYTTEQLKVHGKVILAYLNGSEIEGTSFGEWVDILEPMFIVSAEYRVKQWEPKYMEEVLVILEDHSIESRYFVKTHNDKHYTLPLHSHLTFAGAAYLQLEQYNKIIKKI